MVLIFCLYNPNIALHINANISPSHSHTNFGDRHIINAYCHTDFKNFQLAKIMEYRKIGPASSEVYEELHKSYNPASSEPAVDWDVEIVGTVLISSILKPPILTVLYTYIICTTPTPISHMPLCL